MQLANQLANHLPQLRHAKALITILGAMLCFASAGSMAAEPIAAASTFPGLARAGGMTLKLDLGLTMGAEDCEEDSADMMHMAASSGSSASALDVPQAAGAGAGDTLIAKLAPSENFSVSATPDAPARGMTRIAETATASKPATTVAAVPAVPAVPDAPSAAPWAIVPADKTLNAALARWAAAAGWQLLWELPVDYAVDVRTEIRGSFVEAVGLVAKSMDTAEIPMKAIFYEGNRVLRIVAKGAE